MKSIYTILLILLLNSCNFKAEEGSSIIESTNLPKRSETSVGLILENQTLERSLNLFKNTYSSSQYITLDQNTPSTITFYLDMESDHIDNSIFFKAFITEIESSGDQNISDKLELPIELLESLKLKNGKTRANFQVSGVNSSLNKFRKSLSSLKIEGYSKTLEFSAVLLLRTPPKNITNQKYSFQDFKQKSEKNYELYSRLEIYDDTYFLLNVFEITNHENIPISLENSFESIGSIFEYYDSFTYHDIGCVTPGFSINHSRDKRVVSERVFLKRMNESLLSSIHKHKNFQKSDKVEKQIIQPNETIYFGLYSASQTLFRRIQRLDPLNHLYNQTVPSTCYRSCIRWGERGNVRQGHGQEVCVQEGDFRHTATVLIGNNTTEMFLETTDRFKELRLRFDDLDSINDPKYRSVQIMEITNSFVY